MSLTPREIVAELDRYIVGQTDAKKAVAIALRNRWRRQQIPSPLREEISPKNIIMMGPTGCGKTEIARRLAKLAEAPFVKVEATKFTEVGYVGRDVDSMIRDLVEMSVKICKESALKTVTEKAGKLAEECVLDHLMPPSTTQVSAKVDAHIDAPAPSSAEQEQSQKESREKLRAMLKSGKLDDKDLEIEVRPQGGTPMIQMMGPIGGFDEMASNIQESLEKAMGGGRKKKRRVKVKEALEIFAAEEAQKLIDHDQVHQDAITKAEQSGIIFIDEIDKVAGRDSRGGPDVSREGVQRDLLPIVEGSSVPTKYGIVKTDHILFIAAGAFHITKPSDLIPELQGRFPIRVELKSLTEEEFIKILKEPENSLVKQYTALMGTENLKLNFKDDGLRALAKIATQVNSSQENIGARRLYTIMERLFEEESFQATDQTTESLEINESMVQERLNPILENEDMSKFIL